MPYPTSTGPIAGIAVAVILVVLIVIAIVLILVRKSKKAGKIPPPPELPRGVELQEMVFGTSVTEVKARWKNQEALIALQKLLCKYPALVDSMCEVTSAAEMDNLTTALVFALETDGQTLVFLEHCLHREVERAEGEGAGTLFRSNRSVPRVT